MCNCAIFSSILLPSSTRSVNANNAGFVLALSLSPRIGWQRAEPRVGKSGAALCETAITAITATRGSLGQSEALKMQMRMSWRRGERERERVRLESHRKGASEIWALPTRRRPRAIWLWLASSLGACSQLRRSFPHLITDFSAVALRSRSGQFGA